MQVKQYLSMLRDITVNGRDRGDRTGTGTRGLFSYQLRFDLRVGFPLMTTKKLPFRWIVEELLWFLSGSTNVKPLQDKGVSIWDEWATAEQCAKFGREAGYLGPIYGHAWRNFGATRSMDPPGKEHPEVLPSGYFRNGIDQISRLINDIRTTPNSRRLIVTGWDPREATKVALPPCHTLFQFYVQDGELSCQLYQRSADSFLGVPFNIASYALLTHMVAHVCGLRVGEFVHTFGDVHIYNNHREQVAEQLTRTPRKLPILEMTDEKTDIFAFTASDFALHEYDPYPTIKAPVAV